MVALTMSCAKIGGLWRIVDELCEGGCGWIVCLGTVLLPRVWCRIDDELCVVVAAVWMVVVESAAVWWLDFVDCTARMRSG